MRKSLSLLLAVALVFAMFAPLALADEAPLTTQQKFDALKEAGIFSGVLKADGSTDAALDENMTRAQFGIVIAKLLGFSDATPARATFKDLPASHWAYSAVEASVNAGILQGRGNGIFDPNSDVSVQELAIVLVTAVGLSVDDSVTSVPGAAYWAAKYVQAAVAAGLIPAQASYTKAATRAQLVDASYVAAEAIAQSSVTTTEVKVISSKEISVTFSDGVTKSFAVDPALVSGVATKVTFEYNGKTYTETVTLKELSASLKATGAKKLEVSFNQAIDSSKAKFEVKKGTFGVNIKETVLSDDKTTATIELATNLTKGDYTVTVSGLTEKALTATTTVEDERVTKIELTSDKAPFDRDDERIIYAWFKVYNQYNEDVSKAQTGSLSISVGKGTRTASDGKITITSTEKFVLNEKVSVSIVHPTTGAFASGVLTVSPKAQVADFKIVELHKKDDKVLNVTADPANFWLIVEAKDQYGNDVAAADVHKDVLVSNSNPSVVKLASKFTTEDDKTVLRLEKPEGKDELGKGIASVFIVTQISGKQARIDIEVIDTAKVDTMSLSAPEIAVGGETFDIPFTATDQFGAAMTNADDLNKGMLSKLTVSEGTIEFVQDYVKGAAKLQVKANSTDAARSLFINGVTSTGKLVQLSFTLQPDAEPVVISGTKDFSLNFAKGATADLKYDNVVIKDQYARDYDIKDELNSGVYQISVESSDAAKVALTGSVLKKEADKVNFEAKAKGSSTITMKLLDKAGKEVANSAVTVTATVVEKADISSYVVEDVAKLYDRAGSDSHDKELKVTGKLSNGSTVVVPKSYYNVQINNASVTHDVYGPGKLAARNLHKDTYGDKDEVTVPVIVVISAESGPVTIVKEVIVSKKAPEVATVEVIENGKATKEDTNVISVALTDLDNLAEVKAVVVDAVKLVDQYDVEIKEAAAEYSVFINNLGDKTIKDHNGAAKTTIAKGDTFNVTAITGNGKIATFKVIVK